MSRRSYAASAQKMLGRFIVSPSTVREYSGYDWRFYTTPLRRRYMKRQLSQFRRRDGKRFVLEGLAAVYAEQYDRTYDEQADLDQERYDTGLDYDDQFQNDYGCSCCGEYEDDRFHDGADYSAEAEYARDAAYQYEQGYDDWYEESQYDEGYRAGYIQAMNEQKRRTS